MANPNNNQQPIPRTRNTVSVGCKLSHGFKMILYNMIDDDQPVMGGGVKTVKRAIQRTDVEPVTLYGTAWAKGVAPLCLIVDGAAITPNVDKDFVEAWLEQNKNLPAVRNKMIFVHEDISGMAKELKSLRSNEEPLIPDTDPRARNTGQFKVTTGDRKA